MSDEQIKRASHGVSIGLARTDQTTAFLIRELFRQLSPQLRQALVPLMLLMLAGALAEVVTIGAVLPFLAAIVDPGGSQIYGAIVPLFAPLGVSGTGSIYVLAGLFALVALGAAALRLVLLWASHNFVHRVAYQLTTLLYARTLHEPYAYHTQRNSSEIIASIEKVQAVASNVLMPLMQAVIALVIGAFIVAALIAIDPLMALAAGVGFFLIYLGTIIMTRSRLNRNGSIIAGAYERRVKAMQEGLGGIRDVLLDQSQPLFVETYARAETDFRRALVRNAFFANAPRYVVEGAGMILLAGMATIITERPGGLVEAIPILGALAIGAQKLLPAIQQIYAGWAQSTGNRQVLADIMALLRHPAPETQSAREALPFKRSISLDNVCFAYSKERMPVLSGVSLEIPKGARVGIAGRTGSGKSTLTDIVIGLLEPSEGEIRIDGAPVTAENRAAWQRNVAHVPQSIYLADASIAENIAFGVKPATIDHERLRRAAEQAELASVIAGLPQGYDTRIGERGVQLSGGQRQRIGIARALYKQASVLVFDEATSALDTETESTVMAAIRCLDRDLTVLIIAHRLSTLEGCDMVLRLEAGAVQAVDGRWEQLDSLPMIRPSALNKGSSA